ncbi:MAG: lysylphosphatidylglycerol synthase transmembrane domain-containing protein [Ferruginibacter sp.]
MRKRLFSILQYVIFLGGGIFLVWWQFDSMNVAEKKEFYNALNDANYWLLIPVVIMSLLSHLSRSMRWKLLMEPLGYKPKLKNVFAVTMIGYLVNAALPRFGEIVKCTFLSRYEKLKFDKLVGTIIVERTFDVICYIIFIAITILIQINVIGSFAKEKIETVTGSAAGMPLWGKAIIIFAIIITVLYLIKLLLKRFPNNKIINKINIFLKDIIEGFKSIEHLKHKRAFILHTLFIWAMYLLQIYVGFFAMEGTAHLSIKAACSVLMVASLAMMITPNGIGMFPIFVMETLKRYHIDDPLGQAFGSLIWGITTSIVLLAGFLALILLPILNRKKNEVSSSDTGEDIQPG